MEGNMPKIEMRRLDDLREYPNNARKITERAVEYVADSIREVGFLNPIVVTKDGEIVCGQVSMRERGKSVGFGRKFIWDDDVPMTAVAGDTMIRMPDRTLCSMEDVRAIGTFPQDYVFSLDGNEKNAKRMAVYMVGMSVPPSMTAHIADQIWEQWLSKDAGKAE